MQDTRVAIASVLQADATLLGLLGGGANSIVDEHDLTSDPNNPWPMLILTYQGSKPLDVNRWPNVMVETWTIRCYDQDNGYSRIAAVLNRVKQLLNRQPFSIVSDTRGVLDMPTWTWDTPDYYDDKFFAENAGSRFRILISDSRYGR